MTKLTNAQADALTTYIQAVLTKREHEKKVRALDKKCKAFFSKDGANGRATELWSLAKENDGKLSNGDFVVTFKTKSRAAFEVKASRRFALDQIIKL